MSYIDSYLIPVPAKNKQAYIDMAKKAHPLFLEHGAMRVVETWGDDLPKGKVNDFYTAVIAEEDEAVVYGWVEWPDKATRDAGNKKIMADPRMQMGNEMPFNGARMIYGGFTPLLDSKNK